MIGSMDLMRELVDDSCMPPESSAFPDGTGIRFAGVKAAEAGRDGLG